MYKMLNFNYCPFCVTFALRVLLNVRESIRVRKYSLTLQTVQRCYNDVDDDDANRLFSI